MPEAVEATTAGAPSEPSQGGEGVAQLTDEQILGLDAGDTPSEAQEPSKPASAAEPVAPAAPAAPPAAPPAGEPPAAPVTPPDDYKWMRSLLKDSFVGPKLQSMRDRLEAYGELYPTVADARAIKELLPGGVEELRGLVAQKQEVDQMDLQYFSRDQEEQRGFAENLYKDDPEAFQSMVRIGLDLIKAQNPQEWPHFLQHFVGESLAEDKAWDWLEYIDEAARKVGAEDVSKLLNQFAGAVFQKYGLGPRTQEDPDLARVAQQRGQLDAEQQAWRAERQQEFNSAADEAVRSALESDIGAQLGKLLPKASEGLRSRMARDIHSEIQSSVGKDAGLALRLRNLMRTGGINRQTREQVVNLLTSKARAILPGAVKRVVGEYTASVMASHKEVTEKQSAAASRVDVSSGVRPGTGVRPLTSEEARGMTAEEILESDRPALPRRR